ncbi:MAG: hypothetical protein AB7P04_08930 [Bacteriovoracia bacterium]
MKCRVVFGISFWIGLVGCGAKIEVKPDPYTLQNQSWSGEIQLSTGDTHQINALNFYATEAGWKQACAPECGQSLEGFAEASFTIENKGESLRFAPVAGELQISHVNNPLAVEQSGVGSDPKREFFQLIWWDMPPGPAGDPRVPERQRQDAYRQAYDALAASVGAIAECESKDPKFRAGATYRWVGEKLGDYLVGKMVVDRVPKEDCASGSYTTKILGDFKLKLDARPGMRGKAVDDNTVESDFFRFETRFNSDQLQRSVGFHRPAPPK